MADINDTLELALDSLSKIETKIDICEKLPTKTHKRHIKDFLRMK